MSSTNSALTSHAEIPPIFSVHFPIFIPIRLLPSATQIAISDAVITYARVSGNPSACSAADV